MPVDHILANLNPQQKEAVEYNEGPLLILAGAGSGKTRVLTRKMAYLVETGLLAPENILAVTFTNKASNEMRKRIDTMIDRDTSAMTVSTFHSLGVRILRQYGAAIGIEAGFTIYDTSDQLSFIKKLLESLKVNEKQYQPRKVASVINNIKCQPLSKIDDVIDHNATYERIFTNYESLMKQSNALDFSDLIQKTLVLLESDANVKAQLQERFKYIMIDEYQDTNGVQYNIAKHLAESHQNICVVGDEDQSIYSWRGADIQNILNFEHDFQGTKTIKLEENYRSTKNIIEAASAVINNNTQRKGKNLFTENVAGDKIVITEKNNEQEESRFIARNISKQCQENGISHSEIAIFYRTNAQSRTLEEELRQEHIPYQIIGGLKFYSRKEIKDVISYLNLIINPKDNVAFRRVINAPTRGIGKTTVEKLDAIASAQQCSLIEASMQAVSDGALHSRANKKVGEFLDMIVKLRSSCENLEIYDLYKEVLAESGYLKMLTTEGTPESQNRIENLEALGNGIVRFAEEHPDNCSLQEFLEHMALVSDSDTEPTQGAVTLMTLHISKGLEYPHVYIAGLEESLFPNARGGESSDDYDDLEEERRLFYVGMTRAEQSLNLTYCRARRHWGSLQFNPPSRFLEEIPSQYVIFNKLKAKSNFAKQNASFNKTDFDFDQSTSYDDDFDVDTDSMFSKGMKVRHPHFGAGSIHQIEGNGDNTKVTILFTDNTLKKFIAKYANLQRI